MGGWAPTIQFKAPPPNLKRKLEKNIYVNWKRGREGRREISPSHPPTNESLKNDTVVCGLPGLWKSSPAQCHSLLSNYVSWEKRVRKRRNQGPFEKVLPFQTFPLFYPEEAQTFNVQVCVNAIILERWKKIHGWLCQSLALAFLTILGYIWPQENI